MPCQNSDYTVSKEIRFEAAHRLINGYPGKCANNHGHSWVVVVTLQLRRGRALDKFGFVKDYGEFKPFKDWVDQNLDHATLISIDDEIFRIWLIENKQRFFIIPGNPTSENLAQLLYRQADLMLSDDYCKVKEVRIKETCTSECHYTENICQCQQ